MTFRTTDRTGLSFDQLLCQKACLCIQKSLPYLLTVRMLSLILLPNLCITLLQLHSGFLKNPHLVSQRSKLSPVPKQLLRFGMLLFPECLTLIHSLKRLHLCFPQSGLFFLLKLCILRSFFPLLRFFQHLLSFCLLLLLPCDPFKQLLCLFHLRSRLPKLFIPNIQLFLLQLLCPCSSLLLLQILWKRSLQPVLLFLCFHYLSPCILHALIHTLQCPDRREFSGKLGKCLHLILFCLTRLQLFFRLMQLHIQLLDMLCLYCNSLYLIPAFNNCLTFVFYLLTVLLQTAAQQP